ncbi:Net1p NDAI_0G05620 [Naumovozyma dairenensis CBS 421]|uniref:Nucleolar protein Dnt1-like N-terminal domain-containing protein n=1 Tax=Naumovozyma dairenensis (strain ATCC 10597 / BCRC 20456 / CBS 421 / NBRC 0211 / NRRL Y-12639) TaxID=1071378 RepID=J7SBT3_NAUDC|nr:hypothetical protein NDAI_0G05620 [Naumovozyma dairenensis CBS 421]CCK73545.1 hypothetical protein NDAI_0G05620 [Naumovozyma dairenensis CBS 421]
MFRLQIELVPPSAQTNQQLSSLTPAPTNNSQLFSNASFVQLNENTFQYPLPPSSNKNFNSVSQNTRKFLHFSAGSNTLLELSDEIIEKCKKIYPNLKQEPEIITLQDGNGYDLDPDFVIEDVFNAANRVKVILRDDIDIDELEPIAQYRNLKRRKTNNGTYQKVSRSQKPINNSLALPKRNNYPLPSTRTPRNLGRRISTPLAQQIYPEPVTDNVEGENADRSFLPPPNVPQSPPIRISSGIDTSKKIVSNIKEQGQVSKSEVVDPDKSKQQRLLLGTPIMTSMTPNRVTLTGQRVVSENHMETSPISTISNPSKSSSKESNASRRISSGMLNIPEPKISEVEKELKVGPASPDSVLPEKPKRIPMKRSLLDSKSIPNNNSDDNLSSDSQDTTSSHSHSRPSLQRQSSIADNNGSPVKLNPLEDDSVSRIVHLAELPHNKKRNLVQENSINELEGKIDQSATKNNLSHLFTQPTGKGNGISNENVNSKRDKLSQIEEEDVLPEQPALPTNNNLKEKVNLETQNNETISITKPGQMNKSDKKKDAGTVTQDMQLESEMVKPTTTTADRETEVTEQETDDEDEVNTTVRINPPESASASGNHSFSHPSIHKTEILKIFDGDSIKLPHWLKKTSSSSSTSSPSSSSRKKPYTTVLHKDIDNSKPDPRNILPQRTPRTAARRAAQLLSSSQGTSQHPDQVQNININNDHSDEEGSYETSSTDGYSSSGVETAGSDTSDNEKIFLREPNDKTKVIKTHHLKEAVVTKSNDNDKDTKQETATSTDNILGKVIGKNPSTASSGNVPEGLTKSQPSFSKINEDDISNNKKINETKSISLTPSNFYSNSKTELKKLNIHKPTSKFTSMPNTKPDSRANNLGSEKVIKLNEFSIPNQLKTDDHKVKPDANPEVPKPTFSPSHNDKLKSLKAKFSKTKPQSSSPVFQPVLTDDSSNISIQDETESMDETSSSSSSDEEVASSFRISRKNVVDTPKGSLAITSNAVRGINDPGLEAAPQSTQADFPTAAKNTPAKSVPITRFLNATSPPTTISGSMKVSSMLHNGLPLKSRPSLSTLSDLVQRGIPNVKEKSVHASQSKSTNIQGASTIETDSTGSSDDSGTDSDTDSSSSSDSDSDIKSSDGSDTNVPSAKSASASLGKNKKSIGGFDALARQSKN